MSDKKQFGIGKINLYLVAVCLVIVVIGFILMTGSSTKTDFNPDIFSTRRITVGPMVSLFGFVAMIFAILYKPKTKEK